jgi:hypothetical protein
MIHLLSNWFNFRAKKSKKRKGETMKTRNIKLTENEVGYMQSMIKERLNQLKELKLTPLETLDNIINKLK